MDVNGYMNAGVCCSLNERSKRHLMKSRVMCLMGAVVLHQIAARSREKCNDNMLPRTERGPVNAWRYDNASGEYGTCQYFPREET